MTTTVKTARATTTDNSSSNTDAGNSTGNSSTMPLSVYTDVAAIPRACSSLGSSCIMHHIPHPQPSYQKAKKSTSGSGNAVSDVRCQVSARRPHVGPCGKN